MILSVLVRGRREELGLSYAAVGRVAGLSSTAVMNIERGRSPDFHLSSLIGLSVALKLPRSKVFEAAYKSVMLPPEVVDFQRGDTSG